VTELTVEQAVDDPRCHKMSQRCQVPETQISATTWGPDGISQRSCDLFASALTEEVENKTHKTKNIGVRAGRTISSWVRVFVSFCKKIVSAERGQEVSFWVFGFSALLGVMGGSGFKRFFVTEYFTPYSTSGRVDRVQHDDH
jgi:hypothetical protein